MYLMSCTRPDIVYAVSKLSNYTSNPRAKDWQGIIRVLKYLQFTRDDGLHYTRYHAVLEGYSDANWISNVKDSKSHNGYLFTLGGGAVSWKSSKQSIIARSIMEYEFIALDKCGEEIEWLRHFLEDIPRWPSMCLQFSYVATINMLLVEYKAICIMVTLDTFIVDTIPLDNYS